MKTIVLLSITLLLATTLFSTTWIINQDGSGDFTSIFVGIIAAQNGDTILVYPGIYYERINFLGKNITITSLYDGDQYDESYIANTIIDGNLEGTVVVFIGNESRNAVLNGFTIRNGYGEFHQSTSDTIGGGIYIRNSSPTISNCLIKNNRAAAGGGIGLITNGSPLLKGNRIVNNHAASYGGGLAAGVGANIEFCSESLNSIYLNYGYGADMFLGQTTQTTVVIDTMTVANPDRYIVVYSTHLPQGFELIVNHGIIAPVAADLYVAPNGCDGNSGLTPDQPLQTIARAMITIEPDSLQQRRVYLAEGIYSRTLNNQFFPILVRSYIDIIGASRESTVFDLEEETFAIHTNGNVLHYSPDDPDIYERNSSVKNLTFINGGNPMGNRWPSGMRFYYARNITLENINIFNCHSGNTPQIQRGTNVIYGVQSYDFVFRNMHIDGCSGRDAIDFVVQYNLDLNIVIENVRITNQVPGPLDPDYLGGNGGGLVLFSYTIPPVGGSLNVSAVNLEITGCIIDNINPFWGVVAKSFLSFGALSGEVRIINSTIGNNYSPLPSVNGIGLWAAVNYEVYNSIIYGNQPIEVYVGNSHAQSNDLLISHSLINGGQEGVYFFPNTNTVVHWGEGNIDADPLWMGDAYPEYPYMLSENSPARNAGILDIPNFEFPEFDLAGNPRIYGDSIDMGAYEWNPNVNISDDFFVAGELPEAHDYKLFNFPNPVVSLKGDGRRGGSTGTSISFQLPKDGHVVIDIYNLKGQFVRRVTNAFMPKGEHTAFWNGKDELERYVATGFYMYKLEIDGRMVATGRCTFIK